MFTKRTFLGRKKLFISLFFSIYSKCFCKSDKVWNNFSAKRHSEFFWQFSSLNVIQIANFQWNDQNKILKYHFFYRTDSDQHIWWIVINSDEKFARMYHFQCHILLTGRIMGWRWKHNSLEIRFVIWPNETCWCESEMSFVFYNKPYNSYS